MTDDMHADTADTGRHGTLETESCNTAESPPMHSCNSMTFEGENT